MKDHRENIAVILAFVMGVGFVIGIVLSVIYKTGRVHDFGVGLESFSLGWVLLTIAYMSVDDGDITRIGLAILGLFLLLLGIYVFIFDMWLAM